MHKFISSFLLIVFLTSSVYGAKKSDNYTIIVSLDAFRWDYPQMYSTPNLDKVACIGVKAESMQPSYPASTFPNHYTLATGLVPDHHGIVNNTFWNKKTGVLYSMGDSATRNNPAYYLGEPIWITAQKQGVKTGNVYWVGSDIAIKNTYPTYYKNYDKKPMIPFAARVDTVISWLNKKKEDRPRLIMLYFSEPDGKGHYFGPKSREVGNEVHYLDSLMGDLMHKIKELPIASKVNVIITSDHGMADISLERVVRVSDYITSRWVEKIDGSNPTSIFTRQGCQDSVLFALNNVDHIKVYKKENIPTSLHYGTSDRIGDVVVCPDCGWQFSDHPSKLMGAHGYDPACPEMQVIFYAYGPDFKKSYKSKGFVNVDIYPLLAYLLGVNPEKTDGDFNRIKDILAK
ncbi:ectonucleotide pyrophosphatase/phosphodiesterase [uncultured Bacteroides sp.]|uniref:alkaline phosphatase family protein n=1 Tax=uncultured Bacteroides sp. TaxID=162156 RepID=UPI002AAA68DC|nr:ectonucleotide pyrophosphatase/phosphodiesterase [uncultured Bacteroides sp.]